MCFKPKLDKKITKKLPTVVMHNQTPVIKQTQDSVDKASDLDSLDLVGGFFSRDDICDNMPPRKKQILLKILKHNKSKQETTKQKVRKNNTNLTQMI